MSAGTRVRASADGRFTETEISRVDPDHVRIVEIERNGTGETIRRDCYDPDVGAAEIGDVMRLENEKLWLRIIDWARSESSHEVTLRWEAVELNRGAVGRIGVFTWPDREPVRTFAD